MHTNHNDYFAHQRFHVTLKNNHTECDELKNKHMNQWFFVFLGGGVGSLVRYWTTKFFEDCKLFGDFPFPTFVANMVSSFIVGLLFGYMSKSDIDNSIWLLLAVGFCGGFSTFSTFSFESFKMLQNGQWVLFSSYILLSIIFGIIMVFLGYQRSF